MPYGRDGAKAPPLPEALYVQEFALSEAELVELFLLAVQTLDSNFEFWVTASFALLVASYFVREEISAPMFTIITGLYISASALFSIRLYTTGRTITSIRDQLESMDAETAIISTAENFLVSGLYFLVVVVGTASTLLFVYSRYKRLRS